MVISSTFSDQAPLTISFYMKEPAGTRDLDGSDEKYGEVWLKLKNDVSSILDEKYGESESPLWVVRTVGHGIRQTKHFQCTLK